MCSVCIARSSYLVEDYLSHQSALCNVADRLPAGTTYEVSDCFYQDITKLSAAVFPGFKSFVLYSYALLSIGVFELRIFLIKNIKVT